MPLSKGQILSDKYRIEQLLGEGGLGCVYKATDTMLSRPVAIKELRPELTQDRTIIQRFRNEAVAASNLNHPNIVTVYDLVQVGGTNCLVMEYLEGGSIADLVAREGKVTVANTTDIALRVCDALAAVHGHGITHRDIKPGTTLLTKEGKPKLTDFGIAHMPRGPGDPRITPDGVRIGAVAYMSPEQAKGLDADHRSDIYSLGATLYEMPTARCYLNFGQSFYASLELIKEKNPIPVRRLIPAGQTGLGRIALNALAKEPGRRFQSAQEMISALKKISVGAGNGHWLLTGILSPIGLGLLAAFAIIRTVILGKVFLPSRPSSPSETVPVVVTRTAWGATVPSLPTSPPTYTALPPTTTRIPPTATAAPRTPTSTFSPVPPTPTHTFTSVPPSSTPRSPTPSPAPASATAGMIYMEAREFPASDGGTTNLRPCYIDKWPPSWDDYRRCTEAGQCTPPYYWKYGPEELARILPMDFATWPQAEQYCRWAGKRLPTLAEWQNSCANGPEYELWLDTYEWVADSDAEGQKRFMCTPGSDLLPLSCYSCAGVGPTDYRVTFRCVLETD